jgi:hypothetical protein
VDELDDVANNTYIIISKMACDESWQTPELTHDQEANSNCLRDPDELPLVGLCGKLEIFLVQGDSESKSDILVQRFMKRVPSLRNSAGILAGC